MTAIPLTLMLTTRPAPDAESEHEISVGDTNTEGAETVVPVKITEQVTSEKKLEIDVRNEMTTGNNDARANAGDMSTENAEGAEEGGGALDAVVEGAADVKGAWEEVGELGGS